ncbi:MAG: potassium transporter TrkH, partial [Proteobacteria bacterium]|nr:potassium transporter TrkH [Pseudomonadota bacterium]
MKSRLFSPYWLPVWFMMAAILIGSLLLLIPECRSNQAASLSFVDSLFTSTSAMCVTGLAVRDTGSFFSSAGQGVILALIQLGGLGIMTYSSLALYLLGRKVSLTDRISVGQSLLRDPTFSLRRYVGRVIFGTLALELIGGVLLFTMDPTGFSPWSALFHAVSAFCNAGFSLFSNSLVGYRDHWGVNLV